MNTEIITLVIRLAVAVMCGIIVPAFKAWLSAKTDNEKIKQIKQAAETAVYAAEQIYNTAEKSDPDGSLRRKYVKKAINMAAYKAGIVLTNAEIESYLEAAVQEINLMKYGAVTVPEEG